MAERIKKHKDIIIPLGIGLALTIVGLLGFLRTNPLSNLVSAATTVTIGVTAEVREYMSMTASTDTVALAPDLINTNGVLGIASSTDIAITVNTNSGDGYNMTIQDNNGGLKSGSNYILLATATGTAATGTDFYGVQATSSDMTLNTQYKFATSTNDIGRIASTTATVFASSTSSGVGKIAYMRVKASCDAAQLNGSYTDTITLTGYSVP